MPQNLNYMAMYIYRILGLRVYWSSPLLHAIENHAVYIADILYKIQSKTTHIPTMVAADSLLAKVMYQLIRYGDVSIQ